MSSEIRDPRIRRNVGRLIKEIIRKPLRILVYGSGQGNQGFWKRQKIAAALSRERGFHVVLPEEVQDWFPKELYMSEQQELLHQVFDFVLIVDSSEGPLTELASFGNNRRFLRKAFLLYPRNYLPNPRYPESFTQDVLAKYLHASYSYTSEEFQRCDLVDRAVAVGKSYRNAYRGSFPSKRF